jgi:nitrogen regulatory protein P-II 1
MLVPPRIAVLVFPKWLADRVQENNNMKMIIAIIQPTKLSALREALIKIGVERMTVCDSQGYGRQRGHTEYYRGVEYKTNLLRKISLEIAVNDDFLERTIDTIVNVARTGPEGNIGDGKIFVLPLDHVTRIGGVTIGPGAV